VPESFLGAVGRGSVWVCWAGELCALGSEVVDDESGTYPSSYWPDRVERVPSLSCGELFTDPN
jgi:hypothetical protein